MCTVGRQTCEPFSSPLSPQSPHSPLGSAHVVDKVATRHYHDFRSPGAARNASGLPGINRKLNSTTMFGKTLRAELFEKTARVAYLTRMWKKTTKRRHSHSAIVVQLFRKTTSHSGMADACNKVIVVGSSETRPRSPQEVPIVLLLQGV